MLDRQEVFAKIDELLEVGGDLVAFNGGFNPKLPLDFYCDLFASVRERYGDRVEFYALTVAEFVYLADRAAALPRRGGGAPPRRGRVLDHGRRERDPHGGLPQAACEVEVHGRRVPRGAARDRRERDADDGDDGDRLRRDARGAARAPAADPRLPGRVPARRPRRALLVPVLDIQAVRHGVRRPGDRATRVLAPHRPLAHLPRQRPPHPDLGADAQNEDAFRALDFGADDFDLPIEDEVTQKAGARIDLDLDRLLEIPRGLGYRVEYRRAERPALAAPSRRRGPARVRKRSSGTSSSSPTSRAISRKV